MIGNELTIKTTYSYDQRQKKQLQASIIAKRKRLTILITKNELLKVELEMVKQEYDVRVGNLFLKDNHLDLEIIHYKNILLHMEAGLTFEQAVKKLSATFYAQQLLMEKEEEEMKNEQEIYEKREQHDGEVAIVDVKKLWKKLIARFHPDLVLDKNEKKEREEIIKQVNKAYEEYDIETLQKLERNIFVQQYQETSVEKLEEILVQIENEIIEQLRISEELQISEWNDWKKRIEKAKRKHEDIFKDLERKLLDDIVRKYAVLNKLKNDVEEKDKANAKR